MCAVKEKNKRKRDEARLERRLKRSNASDVYVEMEKSQNQIEEAQEQVLSDQDDTHKDNDESEISISEPQEERSVQISVQNVIPDEIQNHVNKAEDQQPSENVQFLFEKFNKPASPEPLIKDIGVQVQVQQLVLNPFNY